MNKVFELKDPLAISFNKVEDLLDISVAAQDPFTDKQIVNIGLHLIKNTNDFERALEEWINKATEEQTWLNFKAHFDTAKILLRKDRGNNMKNTIF